MAQSIQQARVDKGTRNNQQGDAVRQAKAETRLATYVMGQLWQLQTGRSVTTVTSVPPRPSQKRKTDTTAKVPMKRIKAK